MILCNSLISLGRFCGKSVSPNTVNHVLLNGTVRFCATEAKAVAKIQIRRLRGARSRFDAGSWVLLTIPVSSFGLGVWQIFRKFEKDELIAKLMEKTTKPPVALPQNLEELKDMEFCSVKVKGKFDHSREIFLGPRPLVEEDSLTKPLSLISNTKGGFLVITPFKLSDRNLTILVNRGWVSKKKKSSVNRPEGQISEEVEIIGLVRNSDPRQNSFFARNNPKAGEWVIRNVEGMAAYTGTDPVFIDAVRESTVPGGPIGGQTVKKYRNDHLSYLITWFSLSGVSGYLWYLRHFLKPPIMR